MPDYQLRVDRNRVESILRDYCGLEFIRAE
jgi:hypothetical protein